VFGAVAGREAARRARDTRVPAASHAHAEEKAASMLDLLRNDRGERLAPLRDAMRDAMEEGVGIYRTTSGIDAACATLAELRERYRRGVALQDRSRTFNTEWFSAIELGYMLDVAAAMAHSARARTESRGAHMRLDGFEARDDVHFLKHSLAHYRADGAPSVDFAPVTITRSPPRSRVYGGAGVKAEMS
jgi:fumarate reductase flavoprotein subunit